MKQHYVSLLTTDDEIQDFFMVKSIAVKLGSNKKQYLDLLLADNTGEITAKKWDIADTELPSLNEIETGEIVKVKAQITEWNGLKQLRVLRIRKSVPQDGVEMSDFIRTAPEKPEDMFAFMEEAVAAINDPELKKLCTRVLTDNKEKLLYYPAAVKNHHAERGGLLYHMKRMAAMGEYFCKVYKNLNRDLVITGVIIHDIEKLNEIDANDIGIASGYSFEGQLLGHLVQGVKTIDRLAKELGISEEKAVMLEHMIIAHHYEPEYGSPKKPLFPEAEILHYLDIVDARMYDMEEALFGTKPGEFSERVWTLGSRKLYKPSF
ncbi:MAG: HD domain-containing protein [Bacillota bacterium]|jgi:3'-5' exoribonuclease|nr:HD domain-containing protein [Bacillota bacterium]NLM08579.1 HD domain-containing protein [Clostridiales Family XIII bacterium]